MSRLKIVLVGFGRFGQNHLRVLKELEKQGQCILYGVVDVNPRVLKNVNKNYKIKISTNLDSFLDDVDVVDIVTPSDTHFDICKKCLNAEKHVFVEKPLTTSYSEAKELAKLARKQEKTLMVGHIFRYNHAVWQIKRMIEEKRFGKVYYMSGHFMGLKDPRTDIGTLYNYAVHHIDIYNYLLDRLPEEVTCCTCHFLGRSRFEDLFTLTLRYPSNIFGIIEGSWLPPRRYRDLTIVGSRKSVISDLLNQTLEIYDSYIEEHHNRLKAVNKGIKKIKIEFQEPLRLELQDLIESINTGKKPLSDVESSLNVILVVEKALESARLGKSVRIFKNE